MTNETNTDRMALYLRDALRDVLNRTAPGTGQSQGPQQLDDDSLLETIQGILGRQLPGTRDTGGFGTQGYPAGQDWEALKRRHEQEREALYRRHEQEREALSRRHEQEMRSVAPSRERDKDEDKHRRELEKEARKREREREKEERKQGKGKGRGLGR